VWLYLALYFVGLLVGTAATHFFDVQLRRPGARPTLLLILFLVLFWAIVVVTQTPFLDAALPVLWLGTGLITGLGSGSRFSSAPEQR
jgi:hypothetical protein